LVVWRLVRLGRSLTIKEYGKMSFINTHKTMVETCICDTCKDEIHTEYSNGWDDTLTDLMGRMYEAVASFKDRNIGQHICRGCKGAREGEYDRYVLSGDFMPSQGCSCHINPPCSYCTSKTDED